MRNIVTQFLAIGLVILSAGAHGAEPSELKAFPDANEGMERLVIVLPHKEREICFGYSPPYSIQ
jgi:serine protease inhibitor ecotin